MNWIGKVYPLFLLAGLTACASQPVKPPPSLQEAVAAFPGTVTALNRNFDVVGVFGSDDGSGPHAAILSNRNLIDIQHLLQVPKLAGSHANSINTPGEVAGSYYVWPPKNGGGVSVSYPFLYRDGKVTTLPTGGVPARAASVNDKGKVVGTAEFDDGQEAVLWQDGGMVQLGRLPGKTWSVGLMINDQDEIIGTSGTGTPSDQGGRRAFFWRDGIMTDLGDIGAGASPRSMNEKGQIVGAASTDDGEVRAFLWQKGKMTELPVLPAFDSTSSDFKPVINPKTHRPVRDGQKCEALLINAQGLVVGKCTLKGDPKGRYSHSVLWQDGHAIDLEPVFERKFNFTHAWVMQISDDGQLICRGTADEFNFSNFVLAASSLTQP